MANDDRHDEPMTTAAPPPPPQRCWRCELEAPGGAAVCPHCAARLHAHVAGDESALDHHAPDATIKLLLGSYAILLVTGIVHALALAVRFHDVAEVDDATRESVLWQVLFVEAIDTLVVVWALIRWNRDSSSVVPSPVSRMVSWLSAMPLLGVLLAINFGYHWLVRQFISSPFWAEELAEQFSWLSLLATCVQPAIVEEAYCRWFALDSLQGVTSRRAAVWISATMFALFHVADLLSMPYFLLFGVVLAHMRLGSGSLLLPVAIHFLHNLFILLWC